MKIRPMRLRERRRFRRRAIRRGFRVSWNFVVGGHDRWWLQSMYGLQTEGVGAKLRPFPGRGVQ